jgi:hypothetical protein
MYAGHFAAGLAIKAAEPRVPMTAVMCLVFLPDLFWLSLSVGGLELVEPGMWFDGWSHSIASIIVQAALVAALWWHRGARVAAAVAAAVLSHLVLDLPMHPAPLEWYPHASTGLGNFLHGWAGNVWLFGKSSGWWFEATVVICGLAIYLAGSRRAGVGKATAVAGAILVALLHVAFG